MLPCVTALFGGLLLLLLLQPLQLPRVVLLWVLLAPVLLPAT